MPSTSTAPVRSIRLNRPIARGRGVGKSGKSGANKKSSSKK